MKYLGGKAAHADQIASVVNGHARHHGVVYEPFCGGGSMTCALGDYFGRVIASDAHPALIPMWRAVQLGWVPPTSLSEDEHRAARELSDTHPLKAFAGFACSFGGTYFKGYSRAANKENFCLEGHNSVLRKAPRLKRATFTHRSYADCLIPDGAVVYCDPPYAGTTGYKGTPKFDSAAFWQWCAQLALRECQVFVSEYQAPDVAKIVWAKKRKQFLKDASGKGADRVEKLFLLQL